MPQGSKLGPLLFNIYVNDMPTQVSIFVLQFTDDLKMFQAIDNVQDFHLLQNDIIKLVDRANKWQLKFKISKCYIRTASW